jgi:hypothetical protein
MSEEERERGAFIAELPLELEEDMPTFVTEYLERSVLDAAQWFEDHGGQLHEGPCERWVDEGHWAGPRVIYTWRGSRPAS